MAALTLTMRIRKKSLSPELQKMTIITAINGHNDCHDSQK